MVVAPAHDDLKGKNVLQTDLALNHINKDLLSKEAETLRMSSILKNRKTYLRNFLRWSKPKLSLRYKSVVKVLTDQELIKLLKIMIFSYTFYFQEELINLLSNT